MTTPVTSTTQALKELTARAEALSFHRAYYDALWTNPDLRERQEVNVRSELRRRLGSYKAQVERLHLRQGVINEAVFEGLQAGLARAQRKLQVEHGLRLNGEPLGR